VSRRANGTEDEARELKARQKTQLGELVIATGADSLSAEELAGLVLVALEQASSAPQTREGWRRRGAAFVQRGNGATGGYGASRPGTRPLAASIRTELNRPSRARRRNSLPIARAGRARTLARPALISSEKAVRSPIPLTRGPGQRLRAVPSGGPRPATNIA
jgi:hypothetical protein